MEECYGSGRAHSWSSESEAAFRVDDLLDFSNEEIGGPIGTSDDNDDSNNSNGNPEAAFSEERNSADSTVTEAATCEVASRHTPNVVEADGAAASLAPPGELCVPTEALEELEWLSSFVGDTFESSSSAFEFLPLAASAPEQKTPLKTWLQGRARSKRRRVASGATSGGSSLSNVLVNGLVARAEAEASVCSPAAAKAQSKAKAKAQGQLSGQEVLSQNRRCSHCLVQKTPQWRTGPLGPKTLCNACGVRFKSGRLLPEYRPALSPTFSSEIHSNCHRKVIEIRRQKETQPEQGQQILA